MKIIVIGAVAAGTSAAAKARRNDDYADIVIYERDSDISYSGCGMPYYIGDRIHDSDELTPRDPAFFKKKYDVDVKIRHEVLAIHREAKTVEVKNLETGDIFVDHYDQLVLATGASPFIPQIEGVNKPHVFTLRTMNDARRIKRYIMENKPQEAVIAGTGFIGFELLENFMDLDMKVTMVEVADQITPNLDKDMAIYLEKQLKAKAVKIYKNHAIEAIEDQKVVLDSKETLPAGLVILATGVRPNTRLAEEAGITLGVTKGIEVSTSMQTNDPSIYACGDCVETFSAITGEPVYHPLGSTANKTGRICGDAMTGGRLRYRGNLGTGIFKLFDLTVATTGLSEKAARTAGYDVEVIHNIKPDKPAYFDGEEMVIKGVADRETGRILGAQIIGTQGVDKRIDVLATLITYKALAEELFHLDLAYAPPYSTTKDPVHYTGMILENAIHEGRPLTTSEALRRQEEDYQIIDARSTGDYESKGHVEGAVNMPHGKLRSQIESLDPNKKTVTYCNKGVTGNAAQNILRQRGFKEVYNLSGGHKFYKGTQSDDE